ncbi:MAG: hypothetical protein WBQ60_12370 [Asticcacaulis sp.]
MLSTVSPPKTDLMKNRNLIIVVLGLASAFFAVMLNLVSNLNPASANTLILEAAIAAVIALICGIITFRRGGGARFLAIAMIGPSVFVLADLAMRLALFLKFDG